MLRYFPISKFTLTKKIKFPAQQLLICFPRFSSSKSDSYSVDDFLNEDLDQIVSEQKTKEMMTENQHSTIISNQQQQQQQQKKQTPSPPKSAASSSINIVNNNRNTVEAARNAMRSGGVVSAFAPAIGKLSHHSQNDNNSSSTTPHSLSEFLFACNELVVEAKQKHNNSHQHQKVEQYWNLHVSRIIEMNCRSTHDLACVARAGKGFGLTIPSPPKENEASSSTSVVFNAWNIISRYQNTTRCLDAMSAINLLVKSQPPLPQAPSPYQSIDDDALAPRYKSFCALHAGHQKMAMENVRYFFFSTPNMNNNSNNQYNEANKKSIIACPQTDYEAICDTLSILDHFTNAKRKIFWPSPPKHIAAKYWETVGNLMKFAVPVCSETLSFTQLIQCLVDCKRLYISCNYLLSEEEEEEIKLNEKLKRIRSSSTTSKNDNDDDLQGVFLSEKSKSTRRHLKRALRNTRHDIASCGVISLLKALVAQAVTLEKFVNSFHFTEVLDVIYVLNLQFLIDNKDQNSLSKENRLIIQETLEMMREVYHQRVVQDKSWKLFSSNNENERMKEEKLKAKLKRVLNV